MKEWRFYIRYYEFDPLTQKHKPGIVETWCNVFSNYAKNVTEAKQVARKMYTDEGHKVLSVILEV